MKPSSIFRDKAASPLIFAAILAVGTTGYILLSPKWTVPVFAWIAPACMLFYFRNANLRLKVLWFVLALLVSQLIASYGVAPFPLLVLAILSIIETLKLFSVYLIDRWILKRSNAFITTLVYPAAFVTKEFLDIGSGGGVWSSIANTQYSFTWLAQLSSVTGLAGISFLIYWFAAVTVRSIERYLNKEKFTKDVLIYAGVFAAVMIFGAMHFYLGRTDNKQTVKIAGLTVPTISILENLYNDINHQTISIDPKTSLVSKEFQQVNAALVPFIEDPNPSRFKNGYKALHILHDSLFALSQEAASKGAKIIVWSEANAIMPEPMKDDFIQRGEAFAAKNKVYLLMALGVFQGGRITPEKMFLENVAILVGPGGQILNVFHKNHPVPFAERSVPGDGKIPAITTSYGTISPSICYDADIPSTMRQLGKNKVDILLLPSGDWYDIAPYHSYMAAFRGIENGCTVVRQVSGGLSLVTDYRGEIQMSFDFYKPGKKFWIADIKTGHTSTIYSTIGDAFAYFCISITVAALLFLLIHLFIKKRTFGIFSE
ncbi:MAG TPA: nitrilase-related carbon-nitrogen hydrolase [Segetibacter sp.]|nr:nitrilase-related carbon-nitrogen hydrolase [Segetibacter sp.]